MSKLTLAFVAFTISWSFGAPASEAAKPYTFNTNSYKFTTDVDKPTAKILAKHMDAVYAEYSKRFADFRGRAREQYPLYVFQRRETYLQFLGKLGINGSGSGGMFFYGSKDVNGLITFMEGQGWNRMLTTLQHEGFHQFAYMRIGPGLPSWANEGLADYFGEAVMVRGKFKPGYVPHRPLISMQALVKESQHLPFEDLLGMSRQMWSARLQSGMGAVQYNQSWSIVHYLIHGDRRYRAAFAGYLKAIANGKSAANAFELSFGSGGYEAFEKGWKEFIMDLKPSDEKHTAFKLEFLSRGMLDLAEKNITIKTLEELEKQLKADDFSLAFSLGHGRIMRIKASDEGMFDVSKTTEGKPSRAKMILKPNRNKKLPPEIMVTGFSVPVRLTWIEGPDKKPESRVEFK